LHAESNGLDFSVAACCEMDMTIKINPEGEVLLNTS